MSGAAACRCGHSFEKHLGYVGVRSDPCAGGTPGFCGCTGYVSAPVPSGNQQRATEEPPWGDDEKFGETCRRDAQLRDQLAEVIAEWMAMPNKPEGWQRNNADDLTADLLPYVHAYEAAAERRGRDEAAAKITALAEELSEHVAHAQQEAREWEGDPHRVSEWEGKAAAYHWAGGLVRALAAELSPHTHDEEQP